MVQRGDGCEGGPGKMRHNCRCGWQRLCQMGTRGTSPGLSTAAQDSCACPALQEGKAPLGTASGTHLSYPNR